jgi:hypothetical protein
MIVIPVVPESSFRIEVALIPEISLTFPIPNPIKLNAYEQDRTK